jgi:hypothetical protein
MTDRFTQEDKLYLQGLIQPLKRKLDTLNAELTKLEHSICSDHGIDSQAWYGTPELSELLGLTKVTIRSHIFTGKFGAFGGPDVKRIGKRHLKVRGRGVFRYLSEHQ